VYARTHSRTRNRSAERTDGRTSGSPGHEASSSFELIWVELTGPGSHSAFPQASSLPFRAEPPSRLACQWTIVGFVDGYADDSLPHPDSRGSARCAVLYRDEKPSEIVYWGITAD